MRTIVKLSSKTPCFLPLVEARIRAFPLWVAKSPFAWLPDGDMKEKEVSQVFVNGAAAVQMDSLAGLRESAPALAAWVQAGRLLYVRLCLAGADSAAHPGAGEWFFAHKSVGVTFAFTDGSFFYGALSTPYRTGMTSSYTQKMSAEIGAYDKLKLNNINVSFLKNVLGDPFDYIGQAFNLYDEHLNKLEMQIVKNASADYDTAALNCKDVRSAFTDKIIDQKFNRADYTNSSGNLIMSEETAKKYKADAAGYCAGVPGVCVNDGAFDSGGNGWDAGWRYIRFGYGTIDVEKLEIEGDQGWFEYPEHKVEGDLGWTAVDKSETLPDGTAVTTTFIRVPAGAVNPPPTGTNEPDYGGSGRRVRCTGTFHSERSNISRPLSVLRYLIERYSSIQWMTAWFNISEITTELDKIKDEPIGIYFDKPTDVFNGIAQLQGGCKWGWQMSTYGGLITARVDDPDRTVSMSAPFIDIANHLSLSVDADAESYVSDLSVKYGKNWESGDSFEYKDAETEVRVLDKFTVSKTLAIESLMKNESGARKRHAATSAYSLGICPRIEGVKLAKFSKYRVLRPYDVVEIDFGDLSSERTWRVIEVSIDYAKEEVAISVKMKAKAF
jgi:hypothetical protein